MPSELGGSPELPQPNTCIPPLPVTERGFGIHIDGTLKGIPRLVYCNGTHVVIRNLEDEADAVLFSAHKAQTKVAKFAPNGEWIASGDADGVLKVWAAKNQLEKNNLIVCRGVLDIAWSGDSKRIIAGGEGGGSMYAKVFNWDSTNAIGNITNVSKKLLSVAFSPERPYKLVTTSEAKQVNFYEGPPFKFAKSDNTHTNYPNCVRFNPDGSQFVTVGSDRKIIFFDGQTGEKLKEIGDSNDGHKGSIYSCCWSPSGDELLTASGDKTCKIWDVETGEVLSTFPIGKNRLDMQVACLWLGDYLISVSLSGFINFLDRDNPAEPKKVWKGHQKTVESVSVGPSGDLVYSSDRGGRVVRFDRSARDFQLFEGDGHGDKPVVGVAVSADGKNLRLLCGSVESANLPGGRARGLRPVCSGHHARRNDVVSRREGGRNCGYGLRADGAGLLA
eukprot:4119_1